jgi:hypothetical protein
MVYDVLERIAGGFGVPRGMMGLGYGEGVGPGSPPAREEVPGEEVTEEMRRRALLGATSVAALGQVIQGLGEVAELALPAREVLPSRLGMVHAQVVEAVTVRLRSVARQFGGQADLFGAAARQYLPWMGIPASDAVKARLGAALAELFTEAGWCAYDSGLPGHGYLTRALKLADLAGDGCGIANAAWHAGAMLVRSGHPDDALKHFQLGQLVLVGFRSGTATPVTVRSDDARVVSITGRLEISSAAAYALMNDQQQAERHLAQARDAWIPRDEYERADKNLNSARILADLGRLDAAQQSAAAAVRTFGDANRRDRAAADTILAELYVRAGEPRGIVLAHHAIDEVSQVVSAPTRQLLIPLAVALQTRPGADAQELARTARQIASTRT